MNIFFKFSFIFFQLYSSYVFSEEINPSKIWMQETNFYNLKISSFKVSANKVHLGLNKEDEIYFSSGDETISKAIISEDKIKIILKKNIPLMNPKSHLQDIHISHDDHIYFSQVGIIDKKKKCRGLTISRLNPNFNNLSMIFHTRPCINKDVGLTSLSGTLASSDTDLFISFSNIIDPKNLEELSCSDMGYLNCLDYYKFMGTIYRIDKNTNEVELVSRGHRRPQGLFYDMTSNVLWETEHGPRGGDELNKILKGKHYGWPYVTLGRYYFINDNKSEIQTKFGSHDGFTLPIFSWTPSVGINQLTVIGDESIFSEYWSGRLVASSLKDQSIYVLNITDGRVLTHEKIFIGSRIRDIEASNKYIFLSTDDGKILVVSLDKKINEGTFPKQ